MKKLILLVVIAVFSLSAGFAFGADAVKKIDKSIATMQPVKAVWTCPPGYHLTGQYQCQRNQPASPCAPGYMVKWGRCPSDAECKVPATGGFDPGMEKDTPECQKCNYQCIAVKQAVSFTCPSGYSSAIGACGMSCLPIPK